MAPLEKFKKDVSIFLSFNVASLRFIMVDKSVQCCNIMLQAVGSANEVARFRYLINNPIEDLILINFMLITMH